MTTNEQLENDVNLGVLANLAHKHVLAGAHINNDKTFERARGTYRLLISIASSLAYIVGYIEAYRPDLPPPPRNPASDR